MEMRHVVVGKTGRAQLVVKDFTGETIPIRHRKDRPEFEVYLLPRFAKRSTSFASSGSPAYDGHDLNTAIMHIQAWTGLSDIDLPSHIEKYKNH